MTSNLNGGTQRDRAPKGASQTTCWHCALKDIEIIWRPSKKYTGAFVGYVHERAKVCSIKPLYGDRWICKVFLAFEAGFPEQEVDDRDTAEQWCARTVQSWFGLLDHE